MVPLRTNSNSRNQAFSKLLTLWQRTITLAEGILGIIKNNPLPTAVIASAIVAPPAYNAVTSSASVIQPPDTQQQEILAHHLENTKQLLERKNNAVSNVNLNEDLTSLLTANSLTTMRILNGRYKGYLVRFLTESELIKSAQPQILLAGADLREIDLHDAWLPDVNLEGTYILNGNLKHVSLKRANLSQAHLDSTDLSGADLTKADMTDANLTDAKLTDTNLTGVDFSGADLRGADLRGAVLKEANLSGAVNIDLSGATLCQTTLPDGSLSNQDCQ